MKVERWAVIFNMQGPGTINEGLIACAWEAPPPPTYDPNQTAEASENGLVVEPLPSGAVRFSGRHHVDVASGVKVELVGGIHIRPIPLGADTPSSGSRVLVRVPVLWGGYGTLLYAAELGTYAEYVARHESLTRERAKAQPPVLWSTPDQPSASAC